MKRDIEQLVSEHPFFAGMRPEWLTLVAGCGRNVGFKAGDLLARAGQPSEAFYALRHGRVALEVHAPGKGALTIQTLQAGDILGWSWLFPPHRWDVDARALEDLRAVAFDCVCLRGKCDADPAFGYDFMRRFAQVFVKRLEATRLQLLDVYNVGPVS